MQDSQFQNPPLEKLRQAFQLSFFAQPDMTFRAPGRVNLIGEHTDYNDGWVMPAALDQALYLAVDSRHTSKASVVILAADLGQHIELPVSRLQDEAPLTGIHWQDMFIGVVREFNRIGLDPRPHLGGKRMVISGDLPPGSGLSSSSALGGLYAMLIDREMRFNLDKIDLARIARDTERNTIGLNCGFMDQYAVFHGREGVALMLDCRSMESIPVDLSQLDMRIELWQSNVEHHLQSSAYNDRRQSCQNVVGYFDSIGVPATHLRDLAEDQIRELLTSDSRVSADVPVEDDLRKALFVFEENRRVHDFSRAASQSDVDRLAGLLLASHWGLSRDYEVTCPETDFIVRCCEEDDFILGARQIGGGFGGSVLVMANTKQGAKKGSDQGDESRQGVNINDLFEQSHAKIAARYQDKFDLELGRMSVAFSDGAGEIKSRKPQ